MCCHSSGRCSGLLAWFASWVTFPICPLISAPLAAISLVRGLRSGSAVAMTRATLLSPFVLVTAVTAMHTTLDYSNGRAHLHPKADVRIGCCERERVDASWSVDPRSRLPIVSEPRKNGASRFMWRVNDRVARMLVKLVGPQQGAWMGALPSTEEASAALGKGRYAHRSDFVAAPDLLCSASQVDFVFVSGHIQGGDWSNAAGKSFRVCSWNNLTLLGTGAGFFVVLDPTGREVARCGDPSR